MRTFNYICLSCGHKVPIDYKEDQTFTKPLNCPKCNVNIPADRIADIVFDLVNPLNETPNNPTQETYIERNING